MSVSYSNDDRVITIVMDDGKVNAMSNDMQATINDALDRAEADGAPVVLAGRDGVFSAGFHLPTLEAGGDDALKMLRGGFHLAARILRHPYPVVMACTGHAMAMGAFLLLSGDHRVGPAADIKLVANEVAIGLTVPLPAIAILRDRLAPSVASRAITLSEPTPTDEAVARGWLDQVVAPDQVITVATQVAAATHRLDLDAHRRTKERLRADLIAEIMAGTDADFPG